MPMVNRGAHSVSNAVRKKSGLAEKRRLPFFRIPNTSIDPYQVDWQVGQLEPPK
jgi:hypothetical protein